MRLRPSWFDPDLTCLKMNSGSFQAQDFVRAQTNESTQNKPAQNVKPTLTPGTLQ